MTKPITYARASQAMTKPITSTGNPVPLDTTGNDAPRAELPGNGAAYVPGFDELEPPLMNRAARRRAAREARRAPSAFLDEIEAAAARRRKR